MVLSKDVSDTHIPVWWVSDLAGHVDEHDGYTQREEVVATACLLVG